jgi:hypothetical protein
MRFDHNYHNNIESAVQRGQLQLIPGCFNYEPGNRADTLKMIFMSYHFFFLAVLMLCYSSRVDAQASQSPYTVLALQDLSQFKPTGGNWKIAGDVSYGINEAGKGKIGSGSGVLVNDLSGKAKDHLITVMEHGDIDLELEFMMDKGSNAGVYLQGRYEIQMFDSWGISPVKTTD